eukprot:scaffold56430_cov32-Tisochrysis_lutea.AAC.3
MTVCIGESSLNSSLSFLPAIWVAAEVAARASTSQRALETEAAAAMSAPIPGKAMHVADCNSGEWMKGRSSTTATVVAAQRPDRAEVKGKIAPARAPWLA